MLLAYYVFRTLEMFYVIINYIISYLQYKKNNMDKKISIDEVVLTKSIWNIEKISLTTDLLHVNSKQMGCLFFDNARKQENLLKD